MWYRFKWDKQNKSLSLHIVMKSPEKKTRPPSKEQKIRLIADFETKRSHRQWNDNFKVLKAWTLNSV